jgi:signal transduction histidine kinase
MRTDTVDPPPSLEAAVQQTWAGLIVVGQDCCIVHANPAAEALGGVRRKGLLGMRFCEAFQGVACAGRADATCLFALALKGRERRSHPRWVTLRAGDITRSVLLSSAPLRTRSPNGGAGRGVVSGAAVTMVPNTLVDEADRRRREMIAAALHELRHSVAVQSVAVDVLAADTSVDLPVEAKSVVGSLRGATAYLMTSLDDLLNRALFDLGAIKVRPRATELWPLLEQVVARLSPVLHRRSQSVALRVVSGAQAWVDPATLEHVLVNLLLNAHKYSVDGDEIVVAVQALPRLGMVQLTVRDHGPGIPRGDRRRIFERFYRAAQTRDKPGAGLGLAIVQSLIKSQGGTVGMRAAPGGGALFWVRLPAKPPVAQEPAPAAG